MERAIQALAPSATATLLLARDPAARLRARPITSQPPRAASVPSGRVTSVLPPLGCTVRWTASTRRAPAVAAHSTPDPRALRAHVACACLLASSHELAGTWVQPCYVYVCRYGRDDKRDSITGPRKRERELTPCLCGSDYGFSEQHRRGKFTASGIACVFDYTPPAAAARSPYNGPAGNTNS